MDSSFALRNKIDRLHRSIDRAQYDCWVTWCNLWICTIHGSACTIYGSLVRAGIHGSRKSRLRNLWIFHDANHFTIVIPRWRRHIDRLATSTNLYNRQKRIFNILLTVGVRIVWNTASRHVAAVKLLGTCISYQASRIVHKSHCNLSINS